MVYPTIDLVPQINKLPRRPGHQTLLPRTREESLTFHYGGVVTLDRSRAGEITTLLNAAAHHLRKNWGKAGQPPVYGDGMMYDVAVLSDGTRVRLRDEARQLWHAGNALANATSYAIHVPLGPSQDLTPAQRDSLIQLFDEKRASRGIPRHAVYGHHEWPRGDGPARPSAIYRRLVGQSECPGSVLHRHLVAYREQDEYSAASALMGIPKATLHHAIRYVLARPHGEYTTWDLAQVILPAYWEQATVLGLDPLLAIAQGMHETANYASWWAARPRRNPAGIGVDGSPGAGCSFADWTRESIPAHLGRLLAYALPAHAPTSLAQEAAIRYALRVRPLDPRARGSAPTLDPLGAVDNPVNQGRARDAWIAGWAWDGANYGEAIAALANRICETPL
jgi:hypothetical protein